MNSGNKKLQKIIISLKKPLPGQWAQEKMYPSDRKIVLESEFAEMKVRKAAVLLLLFSEDDVLFLVLTKRNPDLKEHAGQISFPGGSFERKDAKLERTARREAKEEIGINPDEVQILGTLSDVFIPNSNFLVKPFLSYCSTKPQFIKDEKEVQEILLVPLKDLLDESNRKEMFQIKNGEKVNIPYFCLHDEIVWGATAIILSELKEILLGGGC
jgi:8-oxo-dGTP pyrophosphatase MutT (NUDIX family)